MRLIAAALFVMLALSVALNFYLFGQMNVASLDFEKEKVDWTKQDIKRDVSIPSAAPLSPLEIAFNQGNYSQAIQLYEIALQDSPDLAETVRLQWYELILGNLQESRRLRQRSIYQSFIQDFLKQHPYDPFFLFLEVEASLGRETLTDSLSAFYELLQTDQPESLHRLTENRIDTLLSASINNLTDIGAWELLSNMLERLRAFAPDNRDILINLAEAYANQELFNLMESTLAYLPRHDKDVIRLREMTRPAQNPEQNSQQEMEVVPLSRVGEHYLVTATLDEEVDAVLLLDTGASTSVISEVLFNSLPSYIRPSFVGVYPVNTAGGRVSAPLYRFNSLSVGQSTVQDIAIIVLPVEGIQGDGLLGMNFLRAFRFQLNQESNELLLTPRS